MDTLLSMKAFCTVAERQSFAAAARGLAMSTAMVSKHVMHLERRLGTRLLNRTSRHVSLTESGALYLERCRQMLEDLDEVESSVSTAATSARGTLKLSVPVWLANATFVGVLAEYRTRYPDVRLDIDLSGRLVNMVEEGIDLALRVTETPGDTLIMRPVGTVLFQLVASREYLARRGLPQRLADLAAHDVLMYSLFTLDRNAPSALGQDFPKVTPVLQSTNETLLHLAALQGMGLAFLPTSLIEQDVEAGRLQAVLTQSRLQTKLYGVYPSRRHLSSKVRTFLDFLCGEPRQW